MFGSKENGTDNQNGRNRLINQLNMDRRHVFFLLYLNELSFGGSAGHTGKMKMMVIVACINDPNVNLVLLHEQDVSKAGCNLGTFSRRRSEAH